MRYLGKTRLLRECQTCKSVQKAGLRVTEIPAGIRARRSLRRSRYGTNISITQEEMAGLYNDGPEALCLSQHDTLFNDMEVTAVACLVYNAQGGTESKVLDILLWRHVRHFAMQDSCVCFIE